MNGKKVDILIVDDRAEKLLSIRTILESLDENLICVRSGREALRQLLDREFAVILLDVNMPEMDGFETAQLIRRRKSSEHTPIIFVTAFGDELNAVEGYSLGAVDYILSPVVPEILRTKVGVFVDLYKKTEEIKRGRTAFLAEASAVLSRSLDVERTLESVARLLVPELGSYGAALLSEEGSGYSGYLARGDRLERVDAIDPTTFDGALVLPLIARGRTLGAIVVERREEHVFAADLANRAAIAIDNARLYRELQETDRKKNEFLAMLGHELRNPLAPIRTAVELLKSAERDPTRIEAARAVIDRQVTQMTRLVDDLLDVSRVTQGKVRLQLNVIELGVVAQHAIETTRPFIDVKNHQLDILLHDEPVFVSGDFARLAQVLANLLHNAAKYTESGGRIVLSISASEVEAQISVRDNGVGIPPPMLSRVFDLFTQVDGSLDRSQGGLGIGLTLVRSLIELHGGRVEARSDGPGSGSEFRIILPRLSAVIEEAAPATIDLRAHVPPGSRVLVVDDNVDAAEMLEQLLAIEGHSVRTAHDGRRAIELAEEFEPEVVLLDIGLPEMDGYDVARRIREARPKGAVFLVAVTGYGAEADRRRAREAGFDDHLVKPVKPDALLAMVAGVSDRHRGLRVENA